MCGEVVRPHPGECPPVAADRRTNRVDYESV